MTRPCLVAGMNLPLRGLALGPFIQWPARWDGLVIFAYKFEKNRGEREGKSRTIYIHVETTTWIPRVAGVGPARQCQPRHPPHCRPSFLELKWNHMTWRALSIRP